MLDASDILFPTTFYLHLPAGNILEDTRITDFHLILMPFFFKWRKCKAKYYLVKIVYYSQNDHINWDGFN